MIKYTYNPYLGNINQFWIKKIINNYKPTMWDTIPYRSTKDILPISVLGELYDNHSPDVPLHWFK